MGIRFKIKGKSHFGWARLSVTEAAIGPAYHRIYATLTGYAYETIPNKPIIAGRTHGPDVILKRATLGALALGRK